MKRIYKTANGKQINLDALMAQNENTIAVGNMKVNARGDQLGPGGKVEVKKEKLIADYYKLNTPVAVDNPPVATPVDRKKDLVDDWIEPPESDVDSDTDIDTVDQTPKLRGKLADSIAQTKLPEKEVPKKTGPSRI